MLYYHLDPSHQTILAGPYGAGDPAIKRLTSCGNPECLDLIQYDLVPEWRETVDAPLGWQAPVIETRDGATVVAVYATGTPEEREAASAQVRRAEMVCTPRQARLALAQSNLLEAVEAWIITQPQATQIEWYHATEIKRTWPPVVEFAVANQISDEALDALLELAATL